MYNKQLGGVITTRAYYVLLVILIILVMSAISFTMKYPNRPFFNRLFSLDITMTAAFILGFVWACKSLDELLTNPFKNIIVGIIYGFIVCLLAASLYGSMPAGFSAIIPIILYASIVYYVTRPGFT